MSQANILFNPYNNLVEFLWLSPTYYKWGSWGPEKLNVLWKFTNPVGQTQLRLTPKLTVKPPSYSSSYSALKIHLSSNQYNSIQWQSTSFFKCICVRVCVRACVFRVQVAYTFAENYTQTHTHAHVPLLKFPTYWAMNEEHSGSKVNAWAGLMSHVLALTIWFPSTVLSCSWHFRVVGSCQNWENKFFLSYS